MRAGHRRGKGPFRRSVPVPACQTPTRAIASWMTGTARRIGRDDGTGNGQGNGNGRDEAAVRRWAP